MRRNKGFTLIEVMVVLSILALIAILAYNFFGSTMATAKDKYLATKIYNHMRIVSDAYELYMVRHGVAPGLNEDVTGSHPYVTEGFLKAAPVFNENDLATDPPDSDFYVYHELSSLDIDGDSNLDGVFAMFNTWWFSDSAAKAFNEMHSSLGATIYDRESQGTWPQNETAFCMKYNTADTNKNECVLMFKVSD